MKTVVVFGGGGFIGRRVVKFLVEKGYHVIVPTRQREKIKEELIVLPNTDIVSCDPTDVKAIETLVAQAEIVINLVGILHESGKNNFESIHVEFTRHLTETISRTDSVRQFIHISALNAMTKAPSRYLRSKGNAEILVTKLARSEWTVIRPSVVFGEGDSFIELFKTLIKYLPLIKLPLADSKFQPIWVDDLALMIINSIHNPKCFGKALTAGGPQVLTLLEIIQALMAAMNKRRPIMKLGWFFSKIMAFGLEYTPFIPPLITRDNLASMSLPATCDKDNDATKLVGRELKSLQNYLVATYVNEPTTISNNEYRQIARRQ